MTDDVTWLTYAELSERLGIAADSARQLVRRKRWQRRPGNEGKTIVAVPIDALEPPVSPPVMPPIEGAVESPVVGSDDTPSDILSPVHVLVARLEAECAGLRELVEAERRRADAAAAHAASVAVDRDAWRVLAERSWWRRLVG